MIKVTKVSLPPLDEYSAYLREVWQNGILTNNGVFVRELELKLAAYLKVKHVVLVSSGTSALQIAIKTLGLTGEIITTPFSFIATSSAIIWESCKPIFVDIDPDTLNINADKIEGAITEKTSGILATHIYGNPCNVEKIDEIAKKHNLKVIYDNAAGFGVKYKGQSLSNHGDISVLSFHATKIFHTVEGGAIITNNDELADKARGMRNFGFSEKEEFNGLGINAKLSELHSIMGLCLLPKIKENIKIRKGLTQTYDELLKNIDISRPKLASETEYNYSYFPILFRTEGELVATKKALEEHQIYPKRYFYPLIANLPFISAKKNDIPIAEGVSKRVLCLPLYESLSQKEVGTICQIISKTIN